MHYLKNIPFLVTAILNILLLIAVFYLMNYVQALLDSDVKINLSEVVTQNKDVISSRLMLEMNNLTLIADQLAERLESERGKPDFKRLRAVFLDYDKGKKDNRLFLAAENGRAVFADGREVDISGRSYFNLTLKGIRNISERTVSRLNGKDIFVISVPLRVDNAIVGAVLKAYSQEDMVKLCALSLFGEQGFMYLVDSRGYIQFSSQNDKYNRESDNYFRLLYVGNKEAAKKLENDIARKRSGFIETVFNGKKMFSAYSPVEGVYDWYLISSVPVNVVSSNAEKVVGIFYFILSAVVLIFAFSMSYFIYFKNKQHANLEHLAFVDPITGGNTYSKFTLDARTILRGPDADGLHIFTFDIENFKYINNFYGFNFGDAMLKRLYESVQSRLLAGETLARIYSDHFVALLRHTDKQRLDALMRSMPEVDGIKIYLAAGLYPVTDAAENINLMVDKANMAASSVKGDRRKHIEVYSEAFDQQMIRNEQLKRAVELALAQDEIVPFFQPKVDINTGRLVGAEALARWLTRDGKLVSPGEFIPICERTGLIVSVDMAIFEKTLRFIRESLTQGMSCTPISVNFSQRHFLDEDFLSAVLEKIREYGVPPRLVEIELTESVIFDNHQMISNFITTLHENGLAVSMDDFGSGYSSLNMLKDIPIDILKIDRGFLKDTVNNARQRIIFAAIAQMAHSLKIKVVVEGVENEENIALMREYGCFTAQGYYYAKPMEADAFRKIYATGIIC